MSASDNGKRCVVHGNSGHCVGHGEQEQVGRSGEDAINGMRGKSGQSTIMRTEARLQEAVLSVSCSGGK